jgi:hypothetical protein
MSLVSNASNAYSAGQCEHREVQVNGVIANIVLESGSEVNVVSASLVAGRVLDATPTGTGVCGETTWVIGAVAFAIDWAGSTTSVRAWAFIWLPYPFLFGTAALYKYGRGTAVRRVVGGGNSHVDLVRSTVLRCQWCCAQTRLSRWRR